MSKLGLYLFLRGSVALITLWSKVKNNRALERIVAVLLRMWLSAIKKLEKFWKLLWRWILAAWEFTSGATDDLFMWMSTQLAKISSGLTNARNFVQICWAASKRFFRK